MKIKKFNSRRRENGKNLSSEILLHITYEITDPYLLHKLAFLAWITSLAINASASI